jgi:outer membrane protein OmpA-like peptidoglycan-associated protein
MKAIHSICAVAVALAIAAGCASVPVESTLLNDANADYQAAANNPRVTKYAPVALKEAEETLRAVDALRLKGADAATVDHRAYIARRKIAIAIQQADLNAAEDDVARARAERDKVVLQARVNDADKLRRIAEVRAREADLARQQAERTKGELESLSQELSALKARGTERGLVLTLGDVLFGFDRAELTSGGQRVVSKLSEFLRRYEKRQIMVEGFTDSIGSEAYNLELSQRRANAVRLALIQRGVDPGRIRIQGYGKAYPVADNGSDVGRQQNRRVEIIISDDAGKIPARGP